MSLKITNNLRPYCQPKLGKNEIPRTSSQPTMPLKHPPQAIPDIADQAVMLTLGLFDFLKSNKENNDPCSHTGVPVRDLSIQQYQQTVTEIAGLSENGDTLFSKGSYGSAQKTYQNALQKTWDSKFFGETGLPLVGYSIPDLERKIRYTEMAVPLVAGQNANDQTHGQINPDHWDRRDPNFSKMWEEYQKISSELNVLGGLGDVLKTKDDAKAQAKINAAQEKIAELAGRLDEIKKYQQGFVNSGYTAELTNQLRGKIKAFLQKPNPDPSEYAQLKYEIENSALPEDEKAKAFTALAEKNKKVADATTDPETKRKHIDNAADAAGKGQATSTKLQSEINQLGLVIFQKELGSKIERINDLILSVKNMDDLDELAKNFTGLMLAMSASPDFRNQIVEQQSGLSGFSTAYFSKMFNPFSGTAGDSGYFEKWYNKNSYGEVLILESKTKGYTAPQLQALIKSNPQIPEVNKLNALLYNLSLFFADPIQGSISAPAQNTISKIEARFLAQRIIYGLTDVVLADPNVVGLSANALRDKLNSALPAKALAAVEAQFGSFTSHNFDSPAQVIAVYLMAMDPDVQKTGIAGVFKNEWPNDGVSRPHVSKILNKGIVSASEIKTQYKKQLNTLKSYFESKGSQAGRALQMQLLDILIEEAR